jgi:hypothetical protein
MILRASRVSVLPVGSVSDTNPLAGLGWKLET